MDLCTFAVSLIACVPVLLPVLLSPLLLASLPVVLFVCVPVLFACDTVFAYGTVLFACVVLPVDLCTRAV